MTTEATLISQIAALSPNMKEDVLKYIHFLQFQEKKNTVITVKKTPKAGFSTLKLEISADFDAPLEDFKDYM
jgi:hypothetical protein